MATIEDLTAVGYEVGVSFEGDGYTAHRVEGPGISTMVRDDDSDTIQGLVDGYAEALLQESETLEETQERHEREAAAAEGAT